MTNCGHSGSRRCPARWRCEWVSLMSLSSRSSWDRGVWKYLPIFDSDNGGKIIRLSSCAGGRWDLVYLIIPSESLSEHQDRVAFFKSRLLYHLAYSQNNNQFAGRKTKRELKKSPPFRFLSVNSTVFSPFCDDSEHRRQKPAQESHCGGSVIKK